MINIWAMTTVTLPTALAIALMAILVRQRNIIAARNAVPVRVEKGAWNK